MNSFEFFLGLLCLGITVYSLYYLYQENRSNRAEPLPVLPFTGSTIEQPITPCIDNFTKGQILEKYVLDSFNKDYFIIQEWRSDKSHNGRSPVANTFPDFLFEFRYNGKPTRFAVECKWRADFQEAGRYALKPYQIENYFRYQKEQRMKVFVIVGIGGQPHQPDHLFVVPLHAFRKQPVYLTASFLEPFAKTPGHGFYLRTDTMQLL